MLFWYQIIFAKLQCEAFVSILSIFHSFWMQRDIMQHKSKEEMFFSVKKPYSKCMRDVKQGSIRLFLLCCCFKYEKTGYQNMIKVKTVCKGHKKVWKLRRNAVMMVFMIFSFFYELSGLNFYYFKREKWFLAPISLYLEDTVSLLL